MRVLYYLFPLVLLYPLEKELYLPIVALSKSFNESNPLFSSSIIFMVKLSHFYFNCICTECYKHSTY